jgi:hypothetical protein
MNNLEYQIIMELEIERFREMTNDELKELFNDVYLDLQYVDNRYVQYSKCIGHILITGYIDASNGGQCQKEEHITNWRLEDLMITHTNTHESRRL